MTVSHKEHRCVPGATSVPRASVYRTLWCGGPWGQKALYLREGFSFTKFLASIWVLNHFHEVSLPWELRAQVGIQIQTDGPIVFPLRTMATRIRESSPVTPAAKRQCIFLWTREVFTLPHLGAVNCQWSSLRALLKTERRWLCDVFPKAK